jgi:dienelactone hydrolase
MPPSPGNVTAEAASVAVEVFDGTAIEKKVALSFGPEKKLRQGVTLTVPKGRGPFPVILRNWSDPKWSALTLQDAREAVRRGYMLVQYVTTDLQADDTEKIGPAKAAYPDCDWGTIAVWAWGGMRVIDYLLTLPETDKTKIAVTGHSRHGKTALLLGALDDRVAAVIPNAGGSGGLQCWRFPIWPEDRGGIKPHESLALMSRVRTYWFHPRLALFAKEVQKLPFDQHFLAALVAPRPLCAVESLEDEYTTPLCSQRSYQAAKAVYAWLGATEKIGVFYRRKGRHAQGAEDWAALLDFADAALLGKSSANPRQFDQVPYPNAKSAFSWRNPAEGK